MPLGLKHNEVTLVPFDPTWKQLFDETKQAILQAIGNEHMPIEHIGSTSIEGISAKPVIDILLGIPDIRTLDATFFKRLQRAGFYELKVKRPHEIVCAKFTDDTFEVKTHFIHIVDFEKQKWNELLFFRNYLNAHSTTKKEYEALKKSFFKTDLHGIHAYTNYKEQFVQMIVEKMDTAEDD